MKKVLVIGASGFLGNEVYRNFEIDSDYEVYGTYTNSFVDGYYHLDMTDLDSIKGVFNLVKPDTVIIVAALTNVEFCENNIENTYKTNVSGIENISKYCKEYKCNVIYISTEYVFDGQFGPYSEKDKVNPINYYGETKLKGEQIIQENCKNYLIVRTTVVYGWDVDSKNFIMQLIENLNSNRNMKVPMDQISSPTYCPNLARMVKESSDRNITGIINLVGSNIIDRYSFAVKAAEILNLNKELLIPVKTETLGQTAKRPLNAGLKTDRILRELRTKPMSILEGLNEVKSKYLEYKSEKNKENSNV